MPAISALSLEQLRNALLVVGLGIIIAVAVAMGLNTVRPIILVMALVALAGLIPTFILKAPLAYWLFLYVFLLPFDIHKRLTVWLIEPLELFDKYGLPPSGSLSLDLYLSDVALIAMMGVWLAKLCLKKETFYFPKVGYIFILYLAWAFLSSLISAESLYMAGFEWIRQVIYFTSFIFIVNVVKERLHFRIIMFALIVGLVFETGAVIAKFEMGVGSETYTFAGIYRERSDTTGTQASSLYASESGEGSTVKRSSGTFAHPALAAYYLEYILPLALVMILTFKSTVLRVLLGLAYLFGCIGLILTFSRSGFLAFAFGVVVTLTLVRWRGLMPRKAFAVFALMVAIAVALMLPIIVGHLTSRPEAFSFRFTLLRKGFDVFLDNPILGAGVNHATSAIPGFKTRGALGTTVNIMVVHNHYLIVLMEVGLIGFLLNFGFFWRVIATGVRCLKSTDPMILRFTIGILGGIASIALHNMGDPFGGHTNAGMLWLYAALIIALDRRAQALAEPRRAAVESGTAPRPAFAHGGGPVLRPESPAIPPRQAP